MPEKFIAINVDADAVKRAMRLLPDRASRTIFRASLREHTRRFVFLVKPHVPVLQKKSSLGGGSQGRTPGQLRNAIESHAYGGRGRVAYGVFVQSRKALGISGDSRWYYPAHLHYGHTFKRADGGQIIRRLPSSPRADTRGKSHRRPQSIFKKHWKQIKKIFRFGSSRTRRRRGGEKYFDWILRVNKDGYFTSSSRRKLRELEAQGKVVRKVKPRPYMTTPAKMHGQPFADSMASQIRDWISRYAMKFISNE